MLSLLYSRKISMPLMSFGYSYRSFYSKSLSHSIFSPFSRLYVPKKATFSSILTVSSTNSIFGGSSFSSGNFTHLKNATAAKVLTEQTVANRIWTIPNALSFTRLILAPYIGYCLAQGDFVTAFTGFCIAGIFDGLDGWIARKYNQQSILGTYLDPLADKVLLMTSSIGLGFLGILSPYLVTLIVGRDLLLIGGSLSIYFRQKELTSQRALSPAVSALSNSNVENSLNSNSEVYPDRKQFSAITDDTLQVNPSLLSKINTALQITLVAAGISSGAWNIIAVDGMELQVLSLLVAATTFGSGLDYYLNGGMRNIRK